MDKLLSSEESSVQDVKLEKILGPSRDGQWVDDDSVASLREEAGVEESDLDSDAQSTSYLRFTPPCTIATSPPVKHVETHHRFHLQAHVCISDRQCSIICLLIILLPVLQATFTTLRGGITVRTPALMTRGTLSVCWRSSRRSSRALRWTDELCDTKPESE